MFGTASVAAQAAAAAAATGRSSRAIPDTGVLCPRLAWGLRLRGHSDGLGAAAVYRQPRPAGAFFREDTWGNAYLIVFETAWRALKY